MQREKQENATLNSWTIANDVLKRQERRVSGSRTITDGAWMRQGAHDMHSRDRRFSVGQEPVERPVWVPPVPSSTPAPVSQQPGFPGRPPALLIPPNVEFEKVDPKEVARVSQALPAKLAKCLNVLEAELERTENNVRVVHDRKKEIKGEKAGAHYTKAEVDLVAQNDRLLAKRSSLHQQIMSCDRALSDVLKEIGPQRTSTKHETRTSTRKNVKSKPSSQGRSTHRSGTTRKPSKTDDELDALSQTAVQRHASGGFGTKRKVLSGNKRGDG